VVVLWDVEFFAVENAADDLHRAGQQPAFIHLPVDVQFVTALDPIRPIKVAYRVDTEIAHHQIERRVP
jgi:hypothetical protein